MYVVGTSGATSRGNSSVTKQIEVVAKKTVRSTYTRYVKNDDEMCVIWQRRKAVGRRRNAHGTGTGPNTRTHTCRTEDSRYHQPEFWKGKPLAERTSPEVGGNGSVAALRKSVARQLGH